MKSLNTAREAYRIRTGALLLICGSLLAGCSDDGLECELTNNIVSLSSGTSPIHDPAMMKAGHTYYVYSSSKLGSFYSSRDMRDWNLAGEVFEEIPRWLRGQIPLANYIGALDIAYQEGRYLLFYQSHGSDTCDAAAHQPEPGSRGPVPVSAVRSPTQKPQARWSG